MYDPNEYELITAADDVRFAVESLERQDVVGFDTETTSLDPYAGRLRLVQIAAPDGVRIFDLDAFADGGGVVASHPALDPLRRLLSAPRPIKVAHNAKFDAKWIKHHLGVEIGGLFDTLLASQLISAGNQDDRHSLEMVAGRYLNETLDKSEQLSDWSGQLSEAQLRYAARDATVMLPLRERMVARLRSDELVRCAQLEFECVAPVADLELAGIFLDRERWREQLKAVEIKRATLAEELQDMLSVGTSQGLLFANARTDINLDSHTQLTAALKRLGVPVPDSTRNWKLQPLAAEYPVVAKLLEYRTVQKALTSYGANILDEISPVTGRIHANFHQIGAPTGRMSCTQPNIQQVPHAVEYRRCFRAPAGRKLLIHDYSQVELRILADFTGDKGFIEAFQTGADLHRVTAAQIFGAAPEDVTAEQRSFAKRLNFGVVYGIGAQRFSMMTGLSLTEAEDILRRYFATYRALDAWLRNAARQAVRERVAPRTVAGRLARFNFDNEDRQAVSLVQRNGKNSPIQGCVHGGTRIFVEGRGYVAIKDVAGQAISVWDGERFSRARVTYSGQKRLVKMSLRGGHYIECSPDHKFLTIDANGRRWWRSPGEMKQLNWVVLTDAVGDWSDDLRLPVIRPGKAWNASRASLADISDRFELGVYLGRTASDGSVSDRRVDNLVAEHEKEILPYMLTIAGQLGHVTFRAAKREVGRRPLYQLTNSSLSVAGQLCEIGIKTRIPDPAWNDKRVLAGYLRGMFDGDGTVNKDGPALCFGRRHEHLSWAREIQQALLLFGIRSRINLCADRINVRVLKRDAPLFASRIGFINSEKQRKLLSVDAQKHPAVGKIYGRAARVKAVEITSEQVDMYDVVDSETEKFMANGLVTHNSSADIVKRAMRLLHEELRDTSARVVNVVHDEVVVEADEDQAEEIAKKVENAMCAAGEEYVKQVPIKVEYEIADEWVKH